MSRTLSSFLKGFALSVMLALAFAVGCSNNNQTKDECKSNKECQELKNSSEYECKVNDTTKRQECVKKVAQNDNECNADSECSSLGSDYTCQFDVQQNKKRCLKTQTGGCPASCSSNADCAQCTDGKTSCNNSTGSCEAPAPTCPSSCTFNSDCATCPDGKTTCQNGACIAPGPTCPASCSNNTECAACTDGKTTCQNNQCTAPPQCPAVCTDDSACANCPDGRTSCKNNQCVSASQCPANCSVNVDCSQCPDGRNTCQNNQCVAQTPPDGGTEPTPDTNPVDNNPIDNNPVDNNPVDNNPIDNNPVDNNPVDNNPVDNNPVDNTPTDTSTCPSTCATNADCASCPNGNTVCTNGNCGQPSCPNSCSTDAECLSCPGGRTQCNNTQCTAPLQCKTTCANDTDCAGCTGGKTSCQNTVCAVPVNTCPASCTTVAQCAGCGTGWTCANSVCQLPATQGGPGATCDTNNPCATGNSCIGTGTNEAFCFQDCSNSTTACAANTADGRTQCTPFAQDSQGNTISVCLKVAQKGQFCSYAGKSQSICAAGQTPPLFCDTNRRCAESTVVARLDACGGNTNNACNTTNDICVRLSSTAANGFCLGKCTPGTPSTCSNGQCITLSGGGGACLPNGTLAQDQICESSNASATKLDLSKQCASGLTCIILQSGATTGACMKRVTSCTSTACTTGQTCLTLSGGTAGVCAKSCTTDTNCTVSGTSCQNVGASSNICGPTPPAGTVDFGGVCDTNTPSQTCKTGLTCLTAGGSKGVCALNCTQAGTTCPSAGTFSSTCQSVSTTSTTKYCLIGCTTSCPTGLTCTPLTTPSGNFCIAQ